MGSMQLNAVIVRLFVVVVERKQKQTCLLIINRDSVRWSVGNLRENRYRKFSPRSLFLSFCRVVVVKPNLSSHYRRVGCSSAFLLPQNFPMSTSGMVQRIGTGMSIHSSAVPPGSSSGRPAVSSAIACNRCSKPLATTCFLCSCDCIFCEGEFPDFVLFCF